MQKVSSQCSWQPSNFHRTPEAVMRLSRMGSAHQSRLSFMRTLLRRLKREKWQFECSLWDINEQGVGRAVYQAKGPRRTYSLVAFAHELPDELRSDRVIAEAWDSTFTLFDGVPTEADLQRLEANVPKQEAGRVSGKELTMSRANRSMRLFDYMADTLARGKQPEQSKITEVGYLMRTTAVYGSGKFGAADRDFIEGREALSGPFQVEMLTVWLIRTFTLDLVEHAAKSRGGDNAVTLESEIRRSIGVGNSTGLGMAPFIVNHPMLLNNWMMAREEALSRVRSQQTIKAEAFTTFRWFVKRARINANQWQSEHPIQKPKINTLRQELRQLDEYLDSFDAQQEFAWNELYLWAEQQFSEETQEQIAMLMLEPYPDLVDGLTDCMDANESLTLIDARMSVEAMLKILQEHYAWALAMDFSAAEMRSRFWYVSEEKLEPRLGERFDEPGMELEQPLCVSWHVSQLADALSNYKQDAPLAEFLLLNPQFRHVVRRAQLARKYPYMEIQDNLIAADMLPIDLLRLKLSFFGATRFDPRSDRWVRITMFQNAPFPDELEEYSAEAWVYPPLEIEQI